MDSSISEWSDNVAALAVDALIDADLLKAESRDAATAIVAEEVLVRLSLRDYPPIDRE